MAMQNQSPTSLVYLFLNNIWNTKLSYSMFYVACDHVNDVF